MSLPGTQTTVTNWTGVSYGIVLGFMAACMPAFANMNAGPRHLPVIIAATLAIAAWTFAIARRGRVDFGGRPSETGQNSDASVVTRPEQRALLFAAVLFFLWQAQFMAYFTWLPVYLVDVRGFTADGAVLINQIPVVVLLVFALATGFALRAGVGVIPLVIAALALQAGSWLLVPVADSVVIGTISLVAWGIAAGITPTCLWALPSVLLGGHRTDTHAFAVVLTGRYLGILAGPLIAVAIFRFTSDWLAVAYTFGAVTVLCAGAAFSWAFWSNGSARESDGSRPVR